jgi:hypothetical protein
MNESISSTVAQASLGRAIENSQLGAGGSNIQTPSQPRGYLSRSGGLVKNSVPSR